MDFCADCTFFCGDIPLFAPPNADAQNARQIATLAHQIDQPHNPPGRVVVVIPRICAFSLGRTTKKPQTARRVDARSGTVIVFQKINQNQVAGFCALTFNLSRPTLAQAIAGIFGVPVTGSPVLLNSSGKLGVRGTSSARFKEAIKPTDKASEAILTLKPVTFRYKHELDPDGIPQFGLIAEQVEKVNPDLVVRGEDGKVMTVRYEAVNAMLTKRVSQRPSQSRGVKSNRHKAAGGERTAAAAD
jgi:hypothetical protein